MKMTLQSFASFCMKLREPQAGSETMEQIFYGVHSKRSNIIIGYDTF